MCLPNMLAKVCGERSKGAPALAQVATNKPCVGHHAHAAIFARALRAAASSRRHATPRCYKGHGQHRADRAQRGMTDCTTTLHRLLVFTPTHADLDMLATIRRHEAEVLQVNPDCQPRSASHTFSLASGHLAAC